MSGPSIKRHLELAGDRFPGGVQFLNLLNTNTMDTRQKKLVVALRSHGAIIPDEKLGEVNTNNAWGFGGMIGIKFSFLHNGLFFTVSDGIAFYRHIKSHHFTHITVRKEAGGLIADVDQLEPISEEILTKLFNL